jgi:hydroxymethylbilane synthase
MERGKVVRLGTRGSALARRQAELVRQALIAAVPDLCVTVSVIETPGDHNQDQPVSRIGDKGVFVRAIECALLDGSIDLAVHSLKDVPSDVEDPELSLAAFSTRADPRDVIISRDGRRLRELPPGATVGTGSPRRRAQLREARLDLEALNIRGNVDTRLRKLDEGQYDAIVLAAAGLHRLGLESRITEYLPVTSWLPDAGQGIMVVQGRAGDEAVEIAGAIDCPESRLAALAERAVARALHADCHSPIGALARVEGGQLRLDAVAASDDLGSLHRQAGAGPAEQAVSIGLAVGTRLAESLGRTDVYTGP